MEVPPLKASKVLFRLARASKAIDGGWRCGSHGELSDAATALWHLDVVDEDRRELLDPDSGRSWGAVERLALVHFDLHGCFGDPTWDALVDGFETGEGVNPGAPREAQSSEAVVDIDGLKIPLSLQLCTTSIPHGPEGGIFLHMNLKAFNAYFEDDCGQAKRCRRDRQGDYLHVACLLRCGQYIERKESCLLAFNGISRSRSPHGDYMLEYCVFWWFDCVAQGVGHVLSLEVLPGATDTAGALEAFATTELGNAQWNLSMQEGTDIAELGVNLDDEYAVSAYDAGTFDGKIALIRRGGGCGFAHKALTAPGGAYAQINIDRSLESLRQVAPDFKAFQQATKRGEPVHLAVLVERASCAQEVRRDATPPRLSWFDTLVGMPPRYSPLLSRRAPPGTVNGANLPL